MHQNWSQSNWFYCFQGFLKYLIFQCFVINVISERRTKFGIYISIRPFGLVDPKDFYIIYFLNIWLRVWTFLMKVIKKIHNVSKLDVYIYIQIWTGHTLTEGTISWIFKNKCTMTWLTVMVYMCHKWPRICSTCRKHFPVLSWFMTFHRSCN